MNVEIFSAGVDKVQAIKIVREATGWGLKEAKEFVDKIENGSQTLEVYALLELNFKKLVVRMTIL